MTRTEIIGLVIHNQRIMSFGLKIILNPLLFMIDEYFLSSTYLMLMKSGAYVNLCKLNYLCKKIKLSKAPFR